MPVCRQDTSSRGINGAKHDRLTRLLIEEWKSVTDGHPYIIEELGVDGNTSRVVVIWDAWTKLTDIERSEVIVEAFTSHHG